MASQFIKNRAFIQKLKEPEVMDVDFNLEDSALDYSIESLEEDILPEAKPVELFEEREKVRKQRLSDTLTKIGGGLMDESVDFIKREEFADGPKVAAKKSLLKFVNPTYLKLKGPAKSTTSVLKNMDDTEKFYKKFIEYRDKFFSGNTSAAQKSLFPDTNVSSGPQIIRNMRQRLGLKAEEDFTKKAKIKGLKEGLTFSEFRTKLVKEPDFLKNVTKGANVNKFYNTRDLFNLFGITTERGNPKANEYFTGELKRAGIESRPNPAGGQGKQYKLKDVIKFFEETPKTTKLGLTTKEIGTARTGAEKRLDKELFNFNRGVVKNVRETAMAEDVYIPPKTLRASPGDHIGHPVSVKVTDKAEFKNLLKDSNINKINSLVFQDAVVNISALTKQTGYDQKFNTYFKQLNKFLIKPITEKNRTELIKIKNDMDGHYNKIISRINNMSKKNEFFKGQEKRIPKITINIPEVGSKFKSSDLFANMSTVDPEYRYGKIQEINPNAKFFKDLSFDEKQIFKQNIYNQYSDNLNAFYKAAKLPVQDVEEFSRFIEAGGVRETVGVKDIIPTKETGKKKITALQEIYSKAGMNLDPVLAARAVQEEFINPIFGERTRLPASNRGIRALSTAGKIALPETYFAPLSVVLDTYAGRTPKEMALNVATLGFGAPAVDAYKKAQVLKDLGYLSDYKKAMAKINRPDQALAEEVETLGMDTPAEEFAAPEFTKEERLAALIGQVEDIKLRTRLEEKAAEYQKLREDQLKKGLLEVTPEGEELPEDVGIQPEIPLEEEEEEEKSLGVFDRITGNIPRDFMSKGGIMATRLGFSSGTGPFPLRMMFMIKDRMQNLKNSTFSNYNDVFRMGEQKGIKNILEPYKNIPDKNKLITVLEDIDELKKIMPEEYRSILDDIANDTKQFNFKTAKDRTDALAETIPSDMDFKKLSDELFPMPNPENPSFILLGPDSPVSAGRYSTTTTIDKFTGKGKRQVYDTFDEETGEFTRPGKLVEEEPLEEEYSEFIRDMDKPDETN